MINKRPGIYWRLCWAILTPTMMISILIYTFIQYQPLKYQNQQYPDWANCKLFILLQMHLYADVEWISKQIFSKIPFFRLDLGWTFSIIGIAQVPLWAIYAYYKKYISTNPKTNNPLAPTPDWGPKNPQLFEKYQKYISSYEAQQRLLPRTNLFVRVKRHIFD